MDNAVHSYHLKGKKNYSLYMPAPITDMVEMPLRKLANVNALLVALGNKEVRLYNDKHLIVTLNLMDVTTAMRFGRFGREDRTLCMISKSGALNIKILQRQANLEVSAAPPGPPAEQEVPLDIPKKTKLYVEQTQREREQSVEMHRIFQRDLCKLRLETARYYVKIIAEGQGPLSYNSSGAASLRLSAQVQGLGPKFKIKMSIQNVGSASLLHTPVTLSYNHDLYKANRSLLQVPVLLPGLQCHYEFDIECINPDGGSDSIRIFVCNKQSCVPVISAVVNMPMSEPLDEM
jgi:Bardet-Biedl syndrome 1 protein